MILNRTLNPNLSNEICHDSIRRFAKGKRYLRPRKQESTILHYPKRTNVMKRQWKSKIDSTAVKSYECAHA